MTRFDRTKEDFSSDSQENQIKEERVGKVLRVYEHTGADDNSNFEADVAVDGITRLERVAPLMNSSGGRIEVPKVDDKVIVGFLAGESEKPIIKGYLNTVDDRPPLGKAGMTRERFDSSFSPAGDGDLYLTGYTSYSQNPAIAGERGRSIEETFVRIAKRTDDIADPTDESNIPAKIEFYDAPSKDEGHITIEMNKVDGNDSTNPWGVKVNFKTGEVKLVDANSTGIVSDGSGSWTWQYNSKNENQVSGEGSLSL